MRSVILSAGGCNRIRTTPIPLAYRVHLRRSLVLYAFTLPFALAGDYMSAASFLGIAGLVSTSGFDGLIYSTGWLVGWPVVLFLIAEPLRNLGRYTFADVVASRLDPMPVRISATVGSLATIAFSSAACWPPPGCRS